LPRVGTAVDAGGQGQERAQAPRVLPMQRTAWARRSDAAPRLATSRPKKLCRPDRSGTCSSASCTGARGGARPAASPREPLRTLCQPQDCAGLPAASAVAAVCGDTAWCGQAAARAGGGRIGDPGARTGRRQGERFMQTAPCCPNGSPDERGTTCQRDAADGTRGRFARAPAAPRIRTQRAILSGARHELAGLVQSAGPTPSTASARRDFGALGWLSL